MLPHAETYDSMIDQMLEKYVTFSLTSKTSLKNIVPVTRLYLQQTIQLAILQLRDSEERAGGGLCSIVSITVPAFFAATFCHLQSTVPLFDQNQTILTQNSSSGLFTSPILAGSSRKSGGYGRKGYYRRSSTFPGHQCRSRPKSSWRWHMFWHQCSNGTFTAFQNYGARHSEEISCTLDAVQNPLLKHVPVQTAIQADDSLRARMTHLSECEIRGPHVRFDLPAEKCVRFHSTVF